MNIGMQQNGFFGILEEVMLITSPLMVLMIMSATMLIQILHVIWTRGGLESNYVFTLARGYTS